MGPPPEDDVVDALAREATREYTAPRAPGPSAPEEHPPVLLAWTFVAIASLVVALRVDAIIGAMSPPPSLRAGSQVRNAGLDACVDRLWELAALLDQESPQAVVAAPVKEPLSGLPYVVRTDGYDTVISCPTPRRHHVAAVHTRHSAPQPEVVP